ncbi:hypothetical protein AAFF_G00325880 [Aldrovandia affinis]|uniref:RabBD domain-containing protein n=1 Tax=Aldrovandia affinis TaxID=143900 RepID=A0AAD7T9A4_9TELE|nr:hypothetical protein AAFF_G00325880 [Aldrovandia affinis]
MYCLALFVKPFFTLLTPTPLSPHICPTLNQLELTEERLQADRDKPIARHQGIKVTAILLLPHIFKEDLNGFYITDLTESHTGDVHSISIMPATTIKKLDLSRLTDEEAKHVWEVIQRDFDLRKKEEDRLGELKTKIEKEDTKRELLGTQTRLTDSHCIRCLQPFKFLVKSKRQCLDCQLYVCKACSRYNKKEHGWVCDSCRMARMLKIGTLEWYHENVRSRFKRFGSAKVMRSLYKRLNGEHGSQPDLRGPHDDDTHSMPEVHSVYDGHEEDGLDGHRYKLAKGRKTKRRLLVHPLDFDLDNEAHSYRLSSQDLVALDKRRKSMMAETAIFHQILKEQGGLGKDLEFRKNRRKSLEKSTRSDEGGYQQRRMTRTRSLSKIGSSNGPQHLLCNEVHTSDEEEGRSHAPYQPLSRRHSRAVLESVEQPTPPITELNQRMSAIENLLNHLEQKIAAPPEQPEPPTVGQLEEEKLRKKLVALGNVSDKGFSSEEDEAKRRPVRREALVKSARQSPPPLEALLSDSGDEMPSDAQKRSTAAVLCDITTEVLRTINATEQALTQFTPSKPKALYPLMGADVTQADEAYRAIEEDVYITAGKTYDLEKKLQELEGTSRSGYCGTTHTELSELEDKVAQAATEVQNTESEVSDIENKIAVLSKRKIKTARADNMTLAS